MKTGLVLEGGGMRGVFTAGVLDFFLDNNITFNNCIGVSAGACQACSYLTKQKGRGFRTLVDYIDDKHYCGMYSLITTGDIFGVNMAYYKIPNELDPIDNETFLNGETDFYAVVTNCYAGNAEYIKINDLKRDIEYIRASSSLPFVSRKVKIDNKFYLDGGIGDSIPIKQSERFGCDKNIVVLTRQKDYIKEANTHFLLMKARYSKYPKFITSMKNRHIVYNDTIKYICEKEKKGDLFVIRPKEALDIGRIEKNRDKLQAGYDIGYETARENYERMMKYLT